MGSINESHSFPVAHADASVKGMQSMAARRRVQEMLTCVEASVMDSFITSLAALYDTDEDFE